MGELQEKILIFNNFTDFNISNTTSIIQVIIIIGRVVSNLVKY